MPVDHGRQLQADEHEQGRVEEEGDDLPDRGALDPGGRGGQPRGQPAHVDADGDRGEHAGDADRLRRQVGEVGGEEGDRDLDRRVVEPPAHGGDHGADRDPDRDPAGDHDDEVAARLEQAEAAGDHGGDGELVGDQRGRVVDQALALDDGHDPARHPEPAGDRGRGDRVGGGDDRAEHERLRPAEAERLVGDGRRPRPWSRARARPRAARSARMLRRSSRSGVKKAAAYSSGGRMISRTSSGSSSTSGIPGVTASASPPTTSRIGYGIRAHWATISSSVTATRIESRASSVDIADSCSARPS